MKKAIFGLMLLLLSTLSFAEVVEISNGHKIEGHIYEVTDDYIRMYSDGEIIKLRFRNMSIDSAERYRYYTPKPFDLSSVEIKKPPVAPPPKTYREYIREGLGFAQEGEFEKAVAAFGEALSIRDDLWQAYLFRAGVYQEMGDFQKALEDYDTFLTRNPNDAGVFARRGWLYQSQGLIREAIEDYSRVLELDPYNFEILMERYKLYKETEQWWLASKDIDKIVMMFPDEGEAYIDQALLYYRIGSYYKAWQSVYEAGKRKVKVPPDFIKALREKMKDPFLSQKKYEQGILDDAKELVENNKIFLIISCIALILSFVVMKVPTTTKKKRDALDRAIEEEDMMLRMVSFKRTNVIKRMCAGMIDLLVLSIFSWAVQLITPVDVFAVVLAVLFVFRDSFGGVSIGKAMVGLRVIDEYGYGAVFLQGFIRNFTLALPIVVFYVLFWGAHFQLNMVGLIAIGGVLFCYGVEGICIMTSKGSGRRIGDRMANTLVHDLYPNRWVWPFALMLIPLVATYCAGMVILNMTFNKAFLYRLNFLRYYNIERDFSFKIPPGWKLSSEGEGGLVLENPALESAMVIAFNSDVQDYPLSLCVTAFSESLKESGLTLRINENIKVAGRDGAKLGFMKKGTSDALMLVYFKKQEPGELYIVQVSTTLRYMRRSTEEAMDLVDSFRFE